MDQVLKDKLKELLGVCIEHGVDFNYSGDIECISVFKFTDGDISYILGPAYSLRDWNGSAKVHLKKINKAIKNIKDGKNEKV